MSYLLRDLGVALSEPEDTNTAQALGLGLWILMALIVGFFIIPTAVNYTSQYNEALFTVIIVILWIVLYVAETRKETETITGAYSYGSLRRLALGMWAAVIAYGVMEYLIPMTSGNPAYAFSQIQSYSWMDNWFTVGKGVSFFFICLVAAVVEEGFRTVLLPTVQKVLKQPIDVNLGLGPVLGRIIRWCVAAVISTLFWVLYHGTNIWGAQDPLSVFSGLFFIGLFFAVGNYAFGTAAFSVTYHFLHNTGLFISEFGLPDDFWVWAFLLLVVLCFILVTFVVLFQERQKNISLGF